MHGTLETLLLGGNLLSALPNELGHAPALHTLQLAPNPLFYPPAAVVAEGLAAILAFLRDRATA
jgi:hypothetical protein